MDHHLIDKEQDTMDLLLQTTPPPQSGDVSGEAWLWSFGVIALAIVLGFVLGIGRGRGWW
jgi:uncharacterized membrane protein